MEALDACALVSFAIKFEVDGLMEVCEKQMKDGLTHEVVFNVLNVVFSYSVESDGMRVCFFFLKVLVDIYIYIYIYIYI